MTEEFAAMRELLRQVDLDLLTLLRTYPAERKESALDNLDVSSPAADVHASITDEAQTTGRLPVMFDRLLQWASDFVDAVCASAGVDREAFLDGWIKSRIEDDLR